MIACHLRKKKTRTHKIDQDGMNLLNLTETNHVSGIIFGYQQVSQ